MTNFFLSQIDFIYFFYGLGFILMAGVCFVLDKSRDHSLPWKWLGLFGLTHGIKEWLVMTTFSTGDTALVECIHIIFLGVSFLFLVEFGRLGLKSNGKKVPGRWITVVILLAGLIGSIYGWTGLNVTFRYFPGTIGGFWAASAIFYASQSDNKLNRDQNLFISGILLAIFAIVSGIIVPRAPFFPASVLNYVAVQRITGIPVELYRGVISCLLALFLFLHNQSGRVFVKRVNVLLFSFLIIVILFCGWYLVELTGNAREKEELDDLSIAARISAASFNTDLAKSIYLLDNDYNPDYRTVKDRLIKMKNACSDYHSFFIAALKGDSIVILADSNPVTSNIYLPQGRLFTNAPIELYNLFHLKFNNQVKPVNGARGKLYSAFAPVFSGTENKYNIAFGIDRSRELLNRTISSDRIISIFIILLVLSFLVIVYTVFERKKELIDQISISENALRESEERFRSLYENSTIGLYRTTPQGDILLANPTLIRMLGFDNLEELTQRNLEQNGYEPEYSRSIFRSEIEKSGNVIGLESVWNKKNGTKLVVRESAKTIRGADGKVMFYEGTVEDITERKENELQLQKFTEELKSLNATKDKFFSIIAHDLRGPFHVFLGISELLANETEELSREDIISLSRDLNHSLKTQYELLEDLLKWALVSSGSMILEPDYYNTAVEIDNIFNIVRKNALLKNIVLEKEIENNVIVFADKEMLDLVIRNLVSNAIKFTPANGKIAVKVENESKTIKFSVIDNGIGISENDMPKLFRLDSHFTTAGTANEKGTGLGLNLCKEIIEKHGGIIWAESELNLGSRFIFTIPWIHK